jgi:hypothetical protein
MAARAHQPVSGGPVRNGYALKIAHVPSGIPSRFVSQRSRLEVKGKKTCQWFHDTSKAGVSREQCAGRKRRYSRFCCKNPVNGAPNFFFRGAHN